MKYIDKSINRKAGNQIADELLKRAWNNTENKYNGADYDGFTKIEKDELKIFNRFEQESLCCYCLQIISENNTTLEHIIPQRVSVSNLSSYLKVSELLNNVIHKNQFDKNSKLIPPKKYPHDIAYSNLIASCDSNTHCNNYRGKKFVKPFVYDTEINTKVSYDKSGRIVCEEYQNDFFELGLANEYLTLIRRIWKLLSKKITKVESITENEFEEELFGLIDDYEPKSKFIKILTDLTLEKIQPYIWFYNYYKRLPLNNK